MADKFGLDQISPHTSTHMVLARSVVRQPAYLIPCVILSEAKDLQLVDSSAFGRQNDMSFRRTALPAKQRVGFVSATKTSADSSTRRFVDGFANALWRTKALSDGFATLCGERPRLSAGLRLARFYANKQAPLFFQTVVPFIVTTRLPIFKSVRLKCRTRNSYLKANTPTSKFQVWARKIDFAPFSIGSGNDSGIP